MTERFATTPFGRRSLSHALFTAQERVRQARKELSSGGNGEKACVADKWRLLRSLTEARAAYGLSDRTIAVLEALLSFHPASEINGSKPLIVFPSNAELSLRSRGMAPATLRRHLAALVEAGMILRRDSPNGKRYACRDTRGAIETAFGFDLSPLALRMTEIEAHAAQARSHARVLQRLRMEVTIHLRDISKTVHAGLQEGRAGDWQALLQRLENLSGRLARTATMGELTERREALSRLRADVENTYLDSIAPAELSANESESERHIQKSESDSPFDKHAGKNACENPGHLLDLARNGLEVDVSVPNQSRESSCQAASVGRTETLRATLPSLEKLLSTCPQFPLYARDGLRDWRDVLRTAELVRAMLGISPDAWERARRAMGDAQASVTVAILLERSADIRSPGAYLRALTDQALKGRYLPARMLDGLNGQSSPRGGTKPGQCDLEATPQAISISNGREPVSPAWMRPATKPEGTSNRRWERRG